MVTSIAWELKLMLLPSQSVLLANCYYSRPLFTLIFVMRAIGLERVSKLLLLATALHPHFRGLMRAIGLETGRLLKGTLLEGFSCNRSQKPWNKVFSSHLLSPSIARNSGRDSFLGPQDRYYNSKERYEIDTDSVNIPKANKHDRTSKKGKQHRYRFVDKIRLQAMGGRGGKGCLSNTIAGGRKRHPDGGHGGAGGAVILVADRRIQSLQMSVRHRRAKDGDSGSTKKKMGASGDNLVIKVPCGVVVKRILGPDEEWDDEKKEIVGYTPALVMGSFPDSDDDYWKRNMEMDDDDGEDDENGNQERDDDIMNWQEESDDQFASAGDSEENEQEGWVEEWEEDFDADAMMMADEESRQVVTLADLDEHGAFVVVARGGRGGVGTVAHAKKRFDLRPDQYKIAHNAAPEMGELAFLELELKLIADIGLVGFPNAGKSSLLRAMSRATPKVAPYPFTTLHPLLGTIEYRDGFQIKAADIPGLIDGASEGRGCGHDFLRHIERTKALLYIVDVAGTDNRDPHDDLRILAHELGSYGKGDLLERRVIVVANKTDLVDQERVPELLFSLDQVVEEVGLNCEYDVLGTSVGVTGDGLSHLARTMRDIVVKVNKDREEQVELEEQERREQHG